MSPVRVNVYAEDGSTCKGPSLKHSVVDQSKLANVFMFQSDSLSNQV